MPRLLFRSQNKVSFTLACFIASHTPEIMAQQQILHNTCQSMLQKLAIKDSEKLSSICAKFKHIESCRSVQNSPIMHFEQASEKSISRKILAFALIHGDEDKSGIAAASWIMRLSALNPRSNWRIVPVLNPDGFNEGTRTNARGIDLNRNFPTKDWNSSAIDYWKKSSNNDPRRNPGISAASEPETICAMAQIEDFKPDLIISIHTPYGVLDLDGPKPTRMPKAELPWVSLGNYPGSLGRFMWHDKGIPVLTIELTGKEADTQFAYFDRLQDASSDLANKLQKQRSAKMLGLDNDETAR